MAEGDPPYVSPQLQRWRARTDGLLLVLAIGTLPFLLLEIKRDELPASDRWLIDAVNIVVLVAFAVDYVVEVTLTSDRRAYTRHEWTSLLIVFTQALAILPYLGPIGALRALRGVRGLRAAAALARLLAIGGAAAAESRTYLRRNAGRIALGVAGMTWFSSAAAFTLAEDVGEDGRLSSFLDALWWSTETITTDGYGDVFPVTSAGRIVGANDHARRHLDLRRCHGQDCRMARPRGSNRTTTMTSRISATSNMPAHPTARPGGDRRSRVTNLGAGGRPERRRRLG